MDLQQIYNAHHHFYKNNHQIALFLCSDFNLNLTDASFHNYSLLYTVLKNTFEYLTSGGKQYHIAHS